MPLPQNQQGPPYSVTLPRSPRNPHRPLHGIHSVGSRGQTRSRPSSDPSRGSDLCPVSARLNSIFVGAVTKLLKNPASKAVRLPALLPCAHLCAFLTSARGAQTHLLSTRDPGDPTLPHLYPTYATSPLCVPIRYPARVMICHVI